MPERRRALTLGCLEMMDTIARTGSFAAAARAGQEVPSALTYQRAPARGIARCAVVRPQVAPSIHCRWQREPACEGRRLLQIDAVAHSKYHRLGKAVADTIAVDNILAPGQSSIQGSRPSVAALLRSRPAPAHHSQRCAPKR